MQLKIAANAKINLTLFITGCLPNGYHTLDTVMQSVGLQDDITLSLCDESGIHLTCSNPDLCGSENLAYQAAERYLHAINQTEAGVTIRIEKNIPLAGGLGGGSADAAAVLMGLNHLFGEPLSVNDLQAIALPLGADVPFCLVGGTCRATGVGEKLTPLDCVPNGWIVLAKPCQKESTGAMYCKYDEIKGLQDEKSCDIIDEINYDQWNLLCRQLHNDFLPLYEQPALFEAIDMIKQHGAVAASLSGSGPTVFGVFEDFAKAEICSDALNHNYGWSCVVPFASAGWQIV